MGPRAPFFMPSREARVRSRTSVERADVRRLRALRTLRDVERDLLVLAQRLVARALDRREMREHVLAAVVGLDESEALLVVEPLHRSGNHAASPNVKCA